MEKCQPRRGKVNHFLVYDRPAPAIVSKIWPGTLVTPWLVTILTCG